MKALVAAAAAWVTLWGGSPALAAQDLATSGASSGSSSSSVFRAPTVRIVQVSDRTPVVGRRVTVTGRTRAMSRPVRLQVRRAVASGAGSRARTRWVTVDRARSQRGRFVLRWRVGDPGVDRVRVVAPGTRKVGRALTPGVAVLVERRALRPRPPLPRPSLPRGTRGPEPVPRPSPVPPSGHHSPQPVAGVEPAEVQGELSALVRAHRAAHGRTEVGGDACLAGWARDFATAMAATHVFAHSGSSEWDWTRQAGQPGAPRPPSVVPAARACPEATPATYRQEAIARVHGDTASQVAARAFADLRASWMHDEVLLDDTGTGRVMEVGAAQDADGEWFVVVVLAAA